MKIRQFGTKVEGGCPDCGVLVGVAHKGGCDVERCPECGMQRLTCNCITDLPDLPWTGSWPGRTEAAALGLWCKWDKGKWSECSSQEPGRLPDIVRLVQSCKWDKELQTWIKS